MFGDAAQNLAATPWHAVDRFRQYRELLADTDRFVRLMRLEAVYNRSVLDALDLSVLSNTVRGVHEITTVLEGLQMITLQLITYNQGAHEVQNLLLSLGEQIPPRSEPSASAVRDDAPARGAGEKSLVELIDFAVIKTDTLRALSLAAQNNSQLLTHLRTSVRVDNIRLHLNAIEERLR